jgi:hypothetical protein
VRVKAADPSGRGSGARRGWRTGIARITDEDPHSHLERIAERNPRAAVTRGSSSETARSSS